MPLLKNKKHEKFAQAVAKGGSAYDAYRKCVSKKGTRASANVSASRLLKNANILLRIDEFRQEGDKIAKQEVGFTIADAVKFLVSVVNTPVGEVDETNPLCQEVSYSDMGAKKTKMPDKLRALDLLAKLSPNSWFAPQKVEVSGDVHLVAADAVNKALSNLAKK